MLRSLYVPGRWSDVSGFIKPPGLERTLQSTATRRVAHSPRSSGHPADRSELPPRGMAPFGFCAAAQQSVTLRKICSTNSLARTFSAVPLQQTKGSHKWGRKLAFAFLGIEFTATYNESDVLCPTPFYSAQQDHQHLTWWDAKSLIWQSCVSSPACCRSVPNVTSAKY